MALVVRGWGLEVALALGRLRALAPRRRPRRRGHRGPGRRTRSASSCGARPPSRAGWRRRCGTGRRARWFARVLVACELISRHGLLPRIEAIETIPAGRRLRLRLPPGFSAEQLEEASESLAATIGARDVRVVREPANASLAHVSILFRDPLSAPPRRGRCPTGSLWDPLSLGDRRGRQPRLGRAARAQPAARRRARGGQVGDALAPHRRGRPRPRGDASPSSTASRSSSRRGRARPSTSSGPTWPTPSTSRRISAPRWTAATRSCWHRACARSSGAATSGSTSSPSTSSPSTCAAGPRTSAPSSPRRCAT